MMIFDKTKLITAIELKKGYRGLREVCHEIGVSAPTISRVLNGKSPAIETFAAIVGWLEMPVEKFFKEEKTFIEISEEEKIESIRAQDAELFAITHRTKSF